MFPAKLFPLNANRHRSEKLAVSKCKSPVPLTCPLICGTAPPTGQELVIHKSRCKVIAPFTRHPAVEAGLLSRNSFAAGALALASIGELSATVLPELEAPI